MTPSGQACTDLPIRSIHQSTFHGILKALLGIRENSRDRCRQAKQSPGGSLRLLVIATNGIISPLHAAFIGKSRRVGAQILQL